MAFKYQEWKKEESEQRIIGSLSEDDKTFSELLELTDLSKPVLSRRLKELMKKGKVDVVPDKDTKRFLYHLIYENLDTMDELYTKLHVLSKIVVTYLTQFAKDSSISDEEYATKLVEGVSALFNFRLLSYMVGPADIQKEWLKNMLGLEFVTNLPKLFPKNRNIFKHIVKGIPSKELATFKTEDVSEAANQLLESLNTLIERITRK